MIQNQGGELLSVKAFFANNENVTALQSRAEITRITQEEARERLETALNQLDEEGIDTTELRTRLENAGTLDMIQIQSEIKIQINKPDNPGNDDNGSNNGSETQEENSGENENSNDTESQNNGESGSTGNGSGGH
jgi:hypothetical protein